ncbi:MAG: hypothetical protein WCI34_07475 [Actinomycetes bacterium]
MDQQPSSDPVSPPRPPRKSAEERNADLRATLEPLAPGERPGAVTVAAIVSTLLATTNLGLMLANLNSSGGTARPATGIVFAVLLYAAAIGMWKGRYGAVLGFEAFLGITLVFSALSIIVASNLLGFLLPFVILTFGGTLFWKLIRAMGRIQAQTHTKSRP